jgi:hypothetical protein
MLARMGRLTEISLRETRTLNRNALPEKRSLMASHSGHIQGLKVLVYFRVDCKYPLQNAKFIYGCGS